MSTAPSHGRWCITQVTELGTCYSLEELRALGEFCRANGLRLYIDGARLANAAAYLGCSLADIAAEADVLSFGGTKNGAVAAEAVVVMAEDLLSRALPAQAAAAAGVEDAFLAAQFDALLDDESGCATRARQPDGPAAGGRPRRTSRASRCGRRSSPTRCSPARSAHIEPLQREWDFYVWEEQANMWSGWMTAFDTTEGRRGRLPGQHPRGRRRRRPSGRRGFT